MIAPAVAEEPGPLRRLADEASSWADQVGVLHKAVRDQAFMTLTIPEAAVVAGHYDRAAGHLGTAQLAAVEAACAAWRGHHGLDPRERSVRDLAHDLQNLAESVGERVGRYSRELEASKGGLVLPEVAEPALVVCARLVALLDSLGSMADAIEEAAR